MYICSMQSFKIIKPSPILAPFVRYYWILKEDAFVSVSERTLPVGCIQLVFHRGERLLHQQASALQPCSFISGQTLGFSDVQTTGFLDMITVVFQPHAAKIFLRIPLYLFYDRNVDMDETEDRELSDLAKRVMDASDSEGCISLIECFLVHRLYNFPEYNLKRMATVLHQIDLQPQISTSQLSEVACLSNKQFSRIFSDNIGATPKEFMRIVRLQRALSLLQQDITVPFAQVAYECGFSDQSHMIKEFKLFSGYTPAEYLSVCAPYSDYFSTL